jgi:DNA polymerase III delta prime subunit
VYLYKKEYLKYKINNMAFFEENIKEETPNTLWVEKYRPKKLEDYVGNDHLKQKIRDYIESGDVPHLLLYGKAGTGKTTLAKLIVNSINCDFMILNASDENNVDTVRNKVKSFASTIGFKDIKIVILDEFDYMTPQAQAILRNLMETFSKHCRFILTCNYVEKIIDPIQSRCQTFQIIPPTKKDVAVQISKILTEERIQFELKELVPIVDSSYPDIRKIINTCQLNSSKGILKIDSSSISDADVRVKIIDILKSKDDKRNRYINLRQAVADSRVQDFTELYTHLYEKVNDYAVGNTSAVIMILAQGQYKDAMIVDKEICFMATLIEINDVI